MKGQCRVKPWAESAGRPASASCQGSLMGAVVQLLLILVVFPITRSLARMPAVPLQPAAMMQVAAQAPLRLTAADRHRLVQAVAASVRQHYFDKPIADRTASALVAHEQSGDYRAATDGQAFADLLARHLIEASGDNHFTVEYTPRVFPTSRSRPRPNSRSDTAPR